VNKETVADSAAKLLTLTVEYKPKAIINDNKNGLFSMCSSVRLLALKVNKVLLVNYHRKSENKSENTC
jgi:hypothetical protein